MRYPCFIRAGDCMGLTAPSDGNRKEMDYIRLELAKKNIESFGYSVCETPNVRTSIGGRSSDAQTRANELMSLILNDSVKNIVLAKGGDFLMEILPLLDFDEISKHPKWVQGFSDSTGLVFTMTTMCDIATLYSNHFNDFAITPMHDSQRYNLDILKGNIPIQRSFDWYEDGFYDRVRPEESYRQDKKVAWHNGNGKPSVSMKGRALGGCFDVLLNLVGTPYDHVRDFSEKYGQDGIVWFLESFSLDAESITRGLWQLKEAGWFVNSVGFCFGRPCMFESFLGYTYEEAVMAVLKDLRVPVIFDMDIGHKSPQLTIINGALCEVESSGGKGSIEFITT